MANLGLLQGLAHLVISISLLGCHFLTFPVTLTTANKNKAELEYCNYTTLNSNTRGKMSRAKMFSSLYPLNPFQGASAQVSVQGPLEEQKQYNVYGIMQRDF
jgi:hypothetical protein